jgi:hypothetical protein
MIQQHLPDQQDQFEQSTVYRSLTHQNGEKQHPFSPWTRPQLGLQGPLTFLARAHARQQY